MKLPRHRTYLHLDIIMCYKRVTDKKFLEHPFYNEDICNKYPDGSYLELESQLIKLASHNDLMENETKLDTTQYSKVYNISKHKLTKGKYWKKGTGYGTGGTSNWNVQKYLEMLRNNEKCSETLRNTRKC